MDYTGELTLLRTSFKKCRLKTELLKLCDIDRRGSGDDTEEFLSGKLPRTIINSTPDMQTVYKLTDAFEKKYKYMLLDGDSLLIVGPYLSSPITEAALFEIGERNSISPKQQKYLRELYSTIPVLEESCPVFIMLDTFLEGVWKSPSFAIVDLGDTGAPPSPLNKAPTDDGYEDILINMKAMEQRYAFENELIDAVTLGQLHKESTLFTVFSAGTFENRVSDPIRNAKNYGIIMNTLLRKAAERGGVHPVYLDKISSDFASKIEQMSDLNESASLMCEMFRSYCRLVRKHSMRSYSPLVQKTVLIIDSDLSADLSLSSLAALQDVSSGYLSAVFKRETGKTLSEYVRERRIKHAAHLLATTSLQIQTIALHCGILDVQYFSKLFKREIGKTPKEYREEQKRSEDRR